MTSRQVERQDTLLNRYGAVKELVPPVKYAPYQRPASATRNPYPSPVSPVTTSSTPAPTSLPDRPTSSRRQDSIIDLTASPPLGSVLNPISIDDDFDKESPLVLPPVHRRAESTRSRLDRAARSIYVEDQGSSSERDVPHAEPLSAKLGTLPYPIPNLQPDLPQPPRSTTQFSPPPHPASVPRPEAPHQTRPQLDQKSTEFPLTIDNSHSFTNYLPATPGKFKLTYYPLKGQGLEATDDIAKGEVMIREAPFLQFTHPDLEQTIHTTVDGLSPSARTLFLSFTATIPTIADHHVNICETNAIPMHDGPVDGGGDDGDDDDDDDDDGIDLRSGLFEYACRLCHSCAPNVLWRWDETSQRLSEWYTKSNVQALHG